jgi:hypothetical protein
VSACRIFDRAMQGDVVTDEIESSGPRPSRRTVIKGVAAGAAVWAAPVVTSLGTPAYAASPVGCGAGFACFEPGHPYAECGGPSGCICYAETKPGVGLTGQSFCGQDFSCGDLTIQACDPDGACPPGYRCQSGCCGENLCAPICPDESSSLARASASATLESPTNSGQ